MVNGFVIAGPKFLRGLLTMNPRKKPVQKTKRMHVTIMAV
jgi:hypothetical protein